jgi:hypothetical protein
VKVSINEEKQAKIVEIEIDKAPKNNFERLSGYADFIETTGKNDFE